MRSEACMFLKAVRDYYEVAVPTILHHPGKRIKGSYHQIEDHCQQNNNQSADMMNYLLSKNADLKFTVQGFIWGKGYDWETFIPAVNPISYAMMGLLPQMHRNEKTIADVVSSLIKQAYGINYQSQNIPCKYLHS